MNAEHMKTRTKTFALDVVCLCAELPSAAALFHIRGQLQRCAASVAANYRAACRGRSKPEFIAKLGIVEEEADESSFWLEFIQDLNVRQHFKLRQRDSLELVRLQDEANQLLAIIIASRKTARGDK